MATRGPFGVNEPSVDYDFERAAAGRPHFDFDVVVSFLELCRQTGGSGLIVSNDAVFDAYVHPGLACEGSTPGILACASAVVQVC